VTSIVVYLTTSVAGRITFIVSCGNVIVLFMALVFTNKIVNKTYIFSV